MGYWGEMGKVDRGNSHRSSCYKGDVAAVTYDNFGALISNRPALEEANSLIQRTGGQRSNDTLAQSLMSTIAQEAKNRKNTFTPSSM